MTRSRPRPVSAQGEDGTVFDADCGLMYADQNEVHCAALLLYLGSLSEDDRGFFT